MRVSAAESACVRRMVLLWSSVLRMMDDRKRLFVFGTLPSGLCNVMYHKRGQYEHVLEGEQMDRLGKVGPDTLLAVLLSLLLGLLEDEFRYVAVEVFVCDGAGQ